VADLPRRDHPIEPGDLILAAILRGEPPDVGALTASGAEEICSAARAHDVLPLVADRLAHAQTVPVDIRSRFQAESHRAVAVDLVVESELRRLLSAFAARGIGTLLIKGSHLAYSHYARPDLRARIDSDLLIAREQRDAADAVLTGELGYVRNPKASGDLTATQKLYVLARDRVVHLVDLHWRLASPQVFAHVMSFDELMESSSPLPKLGEAARAPGNVHALLLACMHQVAHHHDEPDRFKWLYDIHLIASGLKPHEWNAFAALAAEREVASVCLHGLQRSSHWFGTALPPTVTGDPRLIGAEMWEPTAAYLRVRPKAQEVAGDLRVLRRWRDRATLLREHLFPDPDYMRRVYAPRSASPLAVLYALRIVRGARTWFRRR
jgi:hypothetical protein